MPIPSHISELDEHYQVCHQLTQNIRVKGKSYRQTGHMVVPHPEHGTLKVDLETGNVTVVTEE